MHLTDALLEIGSLIPDHLTVKRVPAALTNQVYQLRSQPHSWALRVNNPNTRALGIDRERENTILDAIRNQHWAVPLVYGSSTVMLTEWQYGEPFTIHSDRDLEKLATLINQVHQLPTDLLPASQDLHLAKHLKFLLAQKPPKPEFEQTLLKWCDRLPSSSERILCHHDWHSGNVLNCKDQLKLLDWEYAACGDRLTDVACVIAGFMLTEAQSKKLYQLCSVDKHAMPPYLAATEAMSILWHMLRFPERSWHTEQQAWLDYWR